MAILSVDQLRAILKSPRNRGRIDAAVTHEKRVKMHSQPVLGVSEFTSAHTRFLEWVASFLDAGKFQTFSKLFLCPLPTSEIVDVIFNEYGRVFNSRDKYISHTFANEEMERGFLAYLSSVGFYDFWNVNALELLKTGFNSFLIVDFAREQTSTRPAPYFYSLPIECVWDVEVKSDGSVEYIAFGQDTLDEDIAIGITAKVIIMDDAMIRTYVKTKYAAEWTLQLETKHGLTYTPAYKFFPLPMSAKCAINSKSPITPSLGDFDRYLFWDISIEHYQLYGAFPIYWGYKQQCGYIDDETGGQCDSDGWIITQDIPDGSTHPVINRKPCPRCAAKKITGAGSFIEVSPPSMKEEADLRDPVGMLGVDVDALNFLQEKQTSRKMQLVYDCTGKAADSITAKEAVNELQVKSNYETRKSILNGIARALEKSMWFTYDAMATIMYGPYYKGTTVDLGKEFFLQSIEELNTDYKSAKDSGRPMYELEQKRDYMQLTQFQNNPDQLSRVAVLKHLEPYQDMSIGELKDMGIDTSDSVNFAIKLNFNTFVRRFERENLPIEKFGEALAFGKKIEAILETFKKYANEQSRNDSG